MRRLWLSLTAALLALPLIVPTVRADDAAEADGDPLAVVASSSDAAARTGPGQAGPAPQQMPGTAGAAPQQIPSKAVPAGWSVYAEPADGFAIALPPGWEVATRGGATSGFPVPIGPNLPGGVRDDNVTWLIAVSPDYQAFAALVLARLDQIVPRNVPRDQVSLDAVSQALDEAGAEIERESDGAVRLIGHRRVQLPAGATEEIRLHAEGPPSARADLPFESVDVTIYLGLTDRELFVLVFATEAASSARYAPIFEQIAFTFRVTR